MAELTLTLPHSEEIEQATLGSMLIDPGCILMLQGIVKPEHFYVAGHADICQALYKLGASADWLTVCQELDAQGVLEKVGGESYVAQLVNVVPTALNAQQYAKTVWGLAKRRRLINAASKIAQAGYDHSTTVEEAYTKAQRELDGVDVSDGRRIGAWLDEDFESWIEDLEHANDGGKPMYHTGIPAIDAKLGGGLTDDEYCIVMGRPGSFKTGLGAQMAYVNGVVEGRKVAYFSYEVRRRKIQNRLVSMHLFATRKLVIPYGRMTKGGMSEPERNAAVDAWMHVCGKQSNIHIADPSAMTPVEVKAYCINLARQRGGLDLVIVDQLQHMSDGDRRSDTRTRVSNVSRGLRELPKDLAEYLGRPIPVVALSRIGRDGYARPTMQDAKESGDIESDAHVMLALHHDAKTPGDLEVGILKSREGQADIWETFPVRRDVNWIGLVG